MTEDEYWARIKRVPLIPERDTTDGQSVICRDQSGTAVAVTKPSPYGAEKRTTMVEFYEMMYSPRLN